ncbi:hypothetical protein CR513_06546, partial [Mucuna pruriens]
MVTIFHKKKMKQIFQDLHGMKTKNEISSKLQS